MNRIFLALILLTLLINESYADFYKGKKIQMFGNSARSLGRGGTGVTSTGVDFFNLNPASIGDIELVNIGLQYGSLPLQTKFYNPEGTLVVPTSYGVWGASFRYFNLPAAIDFRRGYNASFGSARDITKRFLIGFSLNFFKGTTPSISYYAGGNLGCIYKIKSSRRRYGFGFTDPRIGFAAQFGYPFGSNWDRTDFNSVTIGYSFKFFYIEEFSLGLFNDASALNYRAFPVKFGIEAAIYKILILRFGYIYPNEYNKGNFTAGIGINIDTEYFRGSLNYAMNHYRDIKYVHYCGLNIEFGTPDKDPPETEIEVDNRYVSPNHDGIKDYVLFSLNVSDRSRLKGWKLQVLDDMDQIVKTYRIDQRDLIRKITAGEFFQRLFLKRESAMVPDTVIWDGSDFKGDSVKDGRYSFTFTAWDARDNIATLKKGILVVDNTSPVVSIDQPNRLFSPNSDRRKDMLIIHQNIKTDAGDIWEAEFKDNEGNVVRSYRWEGNTVPNKLTWNGTDKKGGDLPEGIYHYSIKGIDKAGNQSLAQVRDITLTRKYEIADITISAKYFSLKKNTTVNFFPYLSNGYGLEKWIVLIKNRNHKIIRQIQGNSNLPKVLEYDFKDDDGDRISDGIYYIQLKAYFKSGNAPESFNKMFIIDSSPPRISVSHSPALFSPDNDGDNDLLSIRTSVRDRTDVKSWRIYIYTAAGDIFKTFSGKGEAPREILWDGLGDGLGEYRELVESAADYFIVMEATDAAGNESRSGKERISVDILVLVTERGLKMRISNIEFSSGSNRLLWRGRRILNRVSTILKKYDKYRVTIEGHTDDVGKEEYNLELSEQRARTVMQFLERRGISGARMKYVGMGETIPIFPNSSEENRRRNRRVEFLLEKEDDR